MSEFVELLPTLTMPQRLEALRIAHETRDDEIRKAALALLREAAPVVRLRQEPRDA